MSQRYNDNLKRSKPKENQLGIKIYAFYQEIQQRALGPGESAAGVTYGPGESAAGVIYLSMRIHLKSCHISL